MKRHRIKSSLSQALDHRLELYSVGAAAAGVSLIALTSPAQAKIVYTPAHIKLTPNHKLPLDLNHDGIKDFEFYDNAPGSYLAINPLRMRNAVAVGGGCNPEPGNAALKAGVLIGKSQMFGPYVCMAQYFGTEGSFGSWPGVSDRFLGLQFVIKGQKHFGWARLNVSRTPYSAVLTGYAYETIPNKPIIAGRTTGPDVVTVKKGGLGALAAGRK